MKNKIVDSHCHLNFDDFKDDLDNVIQNAKEKDVDYMLSISVNLEKFDEIYNLTQKYKNVWCTTGVHPNNVPKKFDIQNITKSIFETCFVSSLCVPLPTQATFRLLKLMFCLKKKRTEFLLVKKTHFVSGIFFT